MKNSRCLQTLSFCVLLFFSVSLNAQNVGIGTNTPVNKLSVNGKVNITDSLGIGTTTPAARLDVSGTVKINDGTQGLGKVLKSDAVGRAVWDSIKVADLLTTAPAYPLCPAVINTVATETNPISVAVSGNYAYVLNAISNILQVFNISNPAAPILSGTVATGFFPISVAVSGNYAYVVNFNGRTLQVFNISNPAIPTLRGTVTVGAIFTAPNAVAVSGNFAYVVNTDNKMLVVNISNPAAPTLSGSVTTAGNPYSVTVSGNYAYVVNYSGNTMQVFNISNPTVPTLSGSVATGSAPHSVAVSGNYAYVVNYVSNSLQVFNVSNPTAPTLAGSVATGNNPRSVAVSGNYAYVVNAGSNNNQVFNISDPATPILLTTVTTGASPSSVAVSGNYAYILNAGSNNMQVISNNPCSGIYNVIFNPGTGQTTALPLQWNTSVNNISSANSGNVGIGTSTPAQKLDVGGTTKTINLQITNGAANGFVLQSDASGNASWVNANTLTVSEIDPKVGTLTSNKIPKWNGTTLADGLVFDNGVNVGIGTISPAQKLDVVGTTRTTNLQMTNGAANGFVLQSDAGGNASWVNANILTITETDPKVGTLSSNKIPKWNGTTLVNGLVFDNGTNVGIGTMTPAEKLDVSGTIKTTNLQITNGAANGFVLQSDASGNASWVNANTLSVTETDPKVGTLSSNIIPKWNGTTLADGLVFDNGTNVGIGTIAPAQALDVNGTTKTNNLQITNGAANGFVLQSDASGNANWVNVNTLTVTETDPKVGTLSSNKIPRWNGTKLADGIVFDNGTNVGIGTLTPAQKLDVAGTTRTTNLQITTGATNGFILKSDASGNASWVNANTIETDPKVGTLTNNKIPKWNGSVLTDGLVFDNGTNLGIGNTAPSNKLSVTGNADITGNLGIGTSSPATTLDVNGGIRTRHSGSVVFDVVGGAVRTLSITIPTLPAGWDATNTVVIVTNADGVDGIIRQAKLTSLTNIDVKYIQDTNGLARLNWIIFKM